jgi:hypothetical protein
MHNRQEWCSADNRNAVEEDTWHDKFARCIDNSYIISDLSITEIKGAESN